MYNIYSIGNVNLKGLNVEKSSDSLLITARREIYVSEEKIILMDQISEQESQFVNGIIKTREVL